MLMQYIESDEKLKQRHAEYGNWANKLREASIAKWTFKIDKIRINKDYLKNPNRYLKTTDTRLI